MKEIDWSKAPKWAGAVISSASGVEYFVSQWGGWSARRVVGLYHDDDMAADMNEPHDWSLVALRSPAWNGEGLPLVGTVCEAWHSGTHQGEVTVLFIGKQTAVLRNHSHGDEQHGALASYKFRPILTPEQIAAEERKQLQLLACADIEADLAQYNTSIDCSAAIRATVDAMIAARYRKQEQPK